MKLFVDANIFIDVQRKRADWKKSFIIVASVINGGNEGYISALTPSIVYFLRRQVTLANCTLASPLEKECK